MNWKRSATGNWVAHDGVRRYAISSIWCYAKDTNKQIRCWRMRIDGTQVGGADKTALWQRVADAKAYADGLAQKN